MAADTSWGRRFQLTGPASLLSLELSRRCHGAATMNPARVKAIAKSAFTQGLLGEPCEMTTSRPLPRVGGACSTTGSENCQRCTGGPSDSVG